MAVSLCMWVCMDTCVCTRTCAGVCVAVHHTPRPIEHLETQLGPVAVGTGPRAQGHPVPLQ